MEISSIFPRFLTEERYSDSVKYGEGNIHETYLINTKSGKKYILQKLNRVVFKDLEALADNHLKITEHLKKGTSENGLHWKVPSLIPCAGGGYLFNQDGDRWRLTEFIENKMDISDSLPLYLKAGISYGLFIKLMSDFPVRELKTTIPDFHNLDVRMEYFKKSLSEAENERKLACRPEADILLAYEEEMRIIPETLSAGGVPVRITHNDSKIDNILFDTREVPVSLIDLDTVMPGIVHFDFGDSIRSFSNPSAEDEIDRNKVRFRMEVFESFSWGFLAVLGKILTQKEKETLVYAPALFAYMQSVRFLTDYLQGNVYYRTAYPDHNLNRSRNQIYLLEDMRDSFREMQRIINEFNY